MSTADEPTRLRAVYRIRSASHNDALDRARWIVREQTLEVPEGVVDEAHEARLLGRVEDMVAASPSGAFDVTITYPADVTGTDLVQTLNVAYGNVSLLNGVRLVDLTLPAATLEALPGPRLGVPGLRALVGAEDGRPLVSAAIKPIGRTPAELAGLAAAFARAGVDVIKDDHGLANQQPAPYRQRVEAVAGAVGEANARTGGRTAYLPNVAGPVDSLEERLDLAGRAGCPGVLIAPSLMGLDVMRGVAASGRGLALMAHPTFAAASPGRREGIAPEVLYGTLYRAAGADVVVYPNAEGRFGWPVEACQAVNARLRAPLGGLRPALPAPAGGIDDRRAGRWFELYGPDTMLLIGGSLLLQNDTEGAARRLVESAAAAGAAS